MLAADYERKKYQRMWKLAAYHDDSPGLRTVHRFLEGCPWRAGQSLVDVGAGTGRAAQALADKGLRVTLLDCCPEANETALPCRNVILWDLPADLPRFDWLFCVDVLEHLPSAFVEATLDQLSELTAFGGYIQIALFDDQCGKLIGETLHLTVRSSQWWTAHMQARWVLLPGVEHTAQYARFLIGRTR